MTSMLPQFHRYHISQNLNKLSEFWGFLKQDLTDKHIDIPQTHTTVTYIKWVSVLYICYLPFFGCGRNILTFVADKKWPFEFWNNPERETGISKSVDMWQKKNDLSICGRKKITSRNEFDQIRREVIFEILKFFFRHIQNVAEMWRKCINGG